MDHHDERSLVPGPVDYYRATNYRRPSYGASLFEVWHHRYCAWAENKILDADRSVLAARQRHVEQDVSLELSIINGQAQISDALINAEEKQEELNFRRAVRRAGPADARSLLATDTEKERRLAVRQGYRSLRLTGGAERLLPAPQAVALPAAELLPDIDQATIEAESLRQFSRLSNVPQGEVNAQYAAAMDELKERYPEYAQAEIASKVDRMLRAVQGRR